MSSEDGSDPRINRTFRDLEKADAADAEVASLLMRMGSMGLIGWPRLLESKRILIVSEAGSGKSYECQAQQKALWSAGEPAFYLDLSQLANNSIDQLLSVEEEERFNKWLAAQYEVATFFLDSIDELKLSLGSFKVALNRLGKAIAGQLGRARVVVTTRPIAIDQQLLEQCLPLPPPPVEVVGGEAFADVAMGLERKPKEARGQDAAPEWRKVGLVPLSEDQIRQMAVRQGVSNPDELIADIRLRNAQDFARRPQDLIELCSDWVAHNRIRTHYEQVQSNIQVKLKPRVSPPERVQLSEEKALDGASRLALAALLTRKLTIRHSAEADRGGEPGTALDPSMVLSDWTANERATLLERALFGFATYGRVRFHHRSVMEFLAAMRINGRLASKMPLRMANRMLFAEASHGLKVVKPTMRPVAAWLAASKADIFAEVRDREPEILLNYADPEVLSAAQRRDALKTFVRRYGSGGFRGISVPELQVQRFASSDLECDVRDLWGPSVVNREVRELLLDLIGAGRMTQCVDIAHAVAIDGSASAGERVSAIAALISMNDSRVSGIVQSMQDNPVLWPHIVLRGALNFLFPAHIAPEKLCEILKRVQKTESAVEVLSYSFPSIISEYMFTPGYLDDLREGLTEVLVGGLVWKPDRLHPRTKRSRLVPVLASVCLRMIRDGNREAGVIRSAVIAHRLHRESDVHDEVSKELRSVLADSTGSIRQAAFWSYDAFNEGYQPQPDPWQRLFNALRYGPIQLEAGRDGDWIVGIVGDKGRNRSERMMMLIAALRYIWDGKENREQHLHNLRQLASDDATLIGAIDEFETPRPVDPETEKFHERQRKQREADERRAEENRARYGSHSWVTDWFTNIGNSF